MAIAGFHNVAIPESSIYQQGGIRTRASSILRMWRELEDECMLNPGRVEGRLRLQNESSEGENENGLEGLSESENGSVNVVDNEIEDHRSMSSEQSQDLGEVERERVRQVFREWMNCGVTARTPDGPRMNRGSRGEWLGETERERVRVVREWIQMTSQQREEQVVEIGSQIERIRDGQVLDHVDGQGENNRREIRQLCGRQALLDLLAKKEHERRLELQGLEATRPVSSFAHRNRIQSLLRIRCFQNTRSAESTRSSSSAESELGLLRQRQPVSGLREAFLSRLDSSVHAQVTDLTDGTSVNSNDVDRLRDCQTRATSGVKAHACVHDQNQHAGDADVKFSGDLNQLSGCSSAEVYDTQESVSRVEASLDLTQENGEDQRLVPATMSLPSDSSDDGNPPLNSEEMSRGESEEARAFEGHREMFHHQHDDGYREEINDFNESDDLEGVDLDYVNGPDSSDPVEGWNQQNMEYEEREWEGSVMSNQWRDDELVETEGLALPHGPEESSVYALENGSGVQIDAQDDDWNEVGSQETPRDWLEMAYGHEATSSGRVDMYYFSDDDNAHNVELRELLNRRRVSSLLRSGFRENLDQLIQSYVERQAPHPRDWELHEMSPPVVHDHDRLDTDPYEAAATAEGIQRVVPTPPPPPPPQTHRRQVLHHANWSSHELRQHPETEWETINDLRINMARLQQRLNNMQRMLETCMDMQLELQQSVRQEVSAALNRSMSSSESLVNTLPNDSSKWECVRKGVCCLCSDGNIDSLLYRCGHMCTCTKCANLLLQGNDKCPMCQAPIIEVIRAYFIQ